MYGLHPTNANMRSCFFSCDIRFAKRFSLQCVQIILFGIRRVFNRLGIRFSERPLIRMGLLLRLCSTNAMSSKLVVGGHSFHSSGTGLLPFPPVHLCLRRRPTLTLSPFPFQNISFLFRSIRHLFSTNTPTGWFSVPALRLLLMKSTLRPLIP